MFTEKDLKDIRKQSELACHPLMDALLAIAKALKNLDRRLELMQKQIEGLNEAMILMNTKLDGIANKEKLENLFNKLYVDDGK